MRKVKAASGRQGDSGGVQFWTGYLNGGNSRGEVSREFSETTEHVSRTSGRLVQGMWIADLTACSGGNRWIYEGKTGQIQPKQMPDLTKSSQIGCL